MTDCCCYDYDPPEFYRAVIRTARHAHRCCECGEEIAPGRKYECVTGKWDGRLDSFKTCARCVNVRTDFFKCGFLHGGLVESFFDCYDFDYREGIPPDFAPCTTTRET
jgi:hypothetical protein